jgi:hypothetical protein
MSKYQSCILSICVMTATSLAGPASSAPIVFKSWEVASEFNDTINPAGVWSYGYEGTLNTSPFALLTIPDTQFAPIAGWQRTSNLNDAPSILHNTTNVVQGPFGSAFVVFPPHAMSMHPGASCEYSDLRFTVPKHGKYRISGQFYAMDYNAGTTTDVHVSVNNVSVYDGQIDFGSGLTSASFTPSHLFVVLQLNDTIDFQVGCGSNGNYFSDTTGLNAVIERK